MGNMGIMLCDADVAICFFPSRLIVPASMPLPFPPSLALSLSETSRDSCKIVASSLNICPEYIFAAPRPSNLLSIDENMFLILIDRLIAVDLFVEKWTNSFFFYD